MKRLISVVLLLAFLSGTPTIAAVPELAWASRRDLSNGEAAEFFDQYRNQNYIITDVDAYPVGSGFQYAMIWEENREHRAWAEWRNLSSSAYHAKWEEYRDRGFRPSGVEAYSNAGSPLFAGIWVKNLENLGWYSFRGLTSTQYANEYTAKKEEGMRLVDMEAYQTPDGLRYAVIWYQNRDGIDWVHHWNLNREDYQQKINELGAAGYRVVDFESYQVGGNQRYAAIWQKRGDREAYQVRSDRTELSLPTTGVCIATWVTA